MTDDDFLSELRIEPFDTKTILRKAKEEFFVRRLGEIERETAPSGLIEVYPGLGWPRSPRLGESKARVDLFWNRFVQENGP